MLFWFYLTQYMFDLKRLNALPNIIFQLARVEVLRLTGFGYLSYNILSCCVPFQVTAYRIIMVSDLDIFIDN